MTIHATIRGLCCGVLLGASIAAAQTPAPAVPTPPVPPVTGGTQRAKSAGSVQSTTGSTAEEPTAPRAGVLVDQVIGVVNDDLILESDVDEERRFMAFQPISNPGPFSREKAIDRLIDRALILQQAKLQPENVVTTEQAQAQLVQLRKDIPACKQYHCETDAGWAKFVAAQGFTQDELTERWRQRMEILKFIEERFRAGIRITPEQIKTYYDKSLLPEYARLKSPAPPIESISDRIQEVLLQQQVGALLQDWLQSLKAQGSVRMMKPGEVAP